jgi:glycolate oxidase iron-sulfur subunit
LPERLPPAQPLPAVTPAQGARRARVALLAGCVQQALAPEIGAAALRVLSRNGVEVLAPENQGCCGALLVHTGEDGEARRMASRNLKVFPQDVDAILTTAAGCGSAMKEYEGLFMGLPEEAQARAFAAQVMDVSQFLDALGLLAPPPLPSALKLAYHDPCHLLHAQGVASPPRRLLTSIPNLTLLEIPDAGMCCGSAGTYNLDQPEIANALGRRKGENILRSGAQAVATGNIGCIVQIRTHLDELGFPLPVYHTIEILDQAYERAASPG